MLSVLFLRFPFIVKLLVLGLGKAITLSPFEISPLFASISDLCVELTEVRLEFVPLIIITQFDPTACVGDTASPLKGFQVVELREILYCEASGSYTNFFFADKHSLCTAKTIHDYEDLLEDAGFVRIHKSFLVNLLHVKEYLRGEGGSVVLSNGKELEVARRKKDLLISKMKEYYKF